MKPASLSTPDDYNRLLIRPDPGENFVVSGKARFELSRYRFRGVFRMQYENQNLRIDFHHSSMFGALKEEASVFIGKDGITLFDQKRGQYYDEERTDKLIGDAVGGRVEPSDILLALLLDMPAFNEINKLRAYAGSGGAWKIKGIYRNRKVEFSGDNESGIEALSIGDSDGRWRGIVFYSYPGGGDNCCGYPEDITIRTADNSLRVNLDVQNVKSSGSR
ncbi:MAG TPA: hypothetical protein VKO43_08685 [Candidatus Krumholzibacteriaceae bacterium]|nr:hypothetical protein [Candidatus Krumholzibacteriaceae bacterium]